MTRTTILLEADLLLEIKQLARAQKTTATAIIREALKSYLGQHATARQLSFTAAGKSGQTRVAERAETILRRKAKTGEGW